MATASLERIADDPRFVTLLRTGDHLGQKAFHDLYKRTPDGFKAELIEGIVYVASPVTYWHGRPHARLNLWLGLYSDDTPGTDALNDTTHILSDDSEPQPDLCLRVTEEYGGQSAENAEGMIVGPPELVVEIAYSSASIDLHAKRRAYGTAGVKEYVIALADPVKVVWFTQGRKGFMELKPGHDGVFRSKVFPGLWLDPDSVFHQTGRRMSSVLRSGLTSPEHAAFAAKLEARRTALAKRKPKT